MAQAKSYTTLDIPARPRWKPIRLVSLTSFVCSCRFSSSSLAFRIGKFLLTTPSAGVIADDWVLSTYQKVSTGITLTLGLIMLLIIILSIIQFAKFRLRSSDFQFETIFVFVLSVVSIALMFSAWDFFGVFADVALVFFSIWLMVYAILVRRRVLEGTAEEMKQPVRRAAEVQVDVELGNAMTVSTPTEPPPSYQPPSQENLSQKVVIQSVFETGRPSQSSVAS